MRTKEFKGNLAPTKVTEALEEIVDATIKKELSVKEESPLTDFEGLSAEEKRLLIE